MTTTGKAPFFSIIIATRNRPELFQTALNSVLGQSFLNKEVVVVIDGSTNENLTRYREQQNQYQGVVFVELEHRPNGHGPSFAANYGASKSSGTYLCFLDDDDQWIDHDFLQRAFASISASENTVDVHYSNQKAVFADGTPQQENVWIQDLTPRVNSRDQHHEDSYFVDAAFLLSSSGFAHLNCSVINREFFYVIGGMDESIRYEQDRDLYIRSVDAARVILYSTRFTSLHNIPDGNKTTNMSTISSQIDKKLYQLRVYDKGIAQSSRDVVVQFCCSGKAYELKHAARILAQNRRYKSAAHYAREALFVGFTFRWLAYTLYLYFQARVKRNSSSDEDQ